MAQQLLNPLPFAVDPSGSAGATTGLDDAAAMALKINAMFAELYLRAGITPASVQVPFTSALQLTYPYFTMPSQQVLGALAFSAALDSTLVQSICQVSLVADGSHTPSAPAGYSTNGSWASAAGKINTLSFIATPGVTPVMVINQPIGTTSQAYVTGIAKTATESVNGAVTITFSGSGVLTAPLPDAAKFTITTTRGGVAITESVLSASFISATKLFLLTNLKPLAGDTCAVSYTAANGASANRLIDAASGVNALYDVIAYSATVTA
jgi:hypothetical protein